ncbi:MAG: S8 family serine peptidase, partial [Phycisphaerales bacterium]|nr:S8 family serine peptidase [Phycisphaerales bacterium]
LLENNTLGLIELSDALPENTRYRLELLGITDLAGNPLSESRLVFFTTVPGDVTGDRRVNNTDVGALASLLGTNPINPANRFHVRADVNTDGRIDQLDLDAVLARRGIDARSLTDPLPGDSSAILGEGPLPDSGSQPFGGGTDGALASGDKRDGLTDDSTAGEADADAASTGPSHEYRLFKRSRGLYLDGTRLAILPTAGTSAADVVDVLAAFEVPGVLVEHWPVDGWLVIHLGEPQASLEIERLASSLVTSGAAGFASPVFTTLEGGDVIITPALLVGFRTAVSDTEARHQIQTTGLGTVVAGNFASLEGVYLVNTPATQGLHVLSSANVMAMTPDVTFAEPVMLFTGHSDLALSQVPASDGLGQLDAAGAWAITRGDPGVSVAIIDSGVELTHPQLAVTTGFDLVGDGLHGEPVSDVESRGTALAGYVASANHGMAPDVRILPIRAMADLGASGTWVTTTTRMVAALDLAQQSQARVTLSGDRFGFESAAISLQYARTRALGVAHFAGASRAGDDVALPGRLSSVMAIGAITDQSEVVETSATGWSVMSVAPGRGVVTIDRIGVAGFSAGDDVVAEGTAAAAAYASGVAALMFSVDPTLSAEDVGAMLSLTSHDLGPSGRDRSFGYGMIDAWRAVRDLLTPGDVNHDGRVDFVDLDDLLDHWGETGASLPWDINHDETVDFLDLSILLEFYGSVN